MNHSNPDKYLCCVLVHDEMNIYLCKTYWKTCVLECYWLQMFNWHHYFLLDCWGSGNGKVSPNMMMVVPPSLRGQVFLIHDNVRYARCVNFPPIPRVQRNVRNVFLLKEKAAAIFFFSADYTEHPPAAAAQCCHFQISNKTYIHQRSCLLCHPCPSDDSSGNQTYRIWGQPLCCF